MSIYVLAFQLSSTTTLPYGTKIFLIGKLGAQQSKKLRKSCLKIRSLDYY